MINLILCGGSGTRLWPLSRQAFPKQFVPVLGGRSLFQDTLTRNSSIFKKACVVTNKDLDFIAERQMDEAGYENERLFVLESVGRNTAPAIALACFNFDPEDIVFVTPSDHMIRDMKSYEKCVRTAILSAEKGSLATFGINPEYPETGYGYIEAASGSPDTSSDILKASGFKEKPDTKTAEKYLTAGNYYWNSGMFVFQAGVFLSELKQHSPDIYEKSQQASEGSSREKNNGIEKIYIPEKLMRAIPAASIDYAVMEKSSSVFVVPSDIGWSDLGSFDALYDISEKNDDGNLPDENLFALDSRNNLTLSNKRKIALVGVDNLTIVDTDDALLVARRGSAQNVKNLVSYLRDGSREERHITEFHSTVHRPWGTYSILKEEPGFKVKKIEVSAGKRLSLQRHKHRSENWVVVTGTAVIQIGDKEYIRKKGESAYIPAGEKHRLTNRGDDTVVIVETQIGESLDENDIERLEDDFGRA